MRAYFASLRAGATADLEGLTYKTTAPISLGGKRVRVMNGGIDAGAHNAIAIVGPGVVLDRGLKLSRSASWAPTENLAQRACVSAAAPFKSFDVEYDGAAHSNVYLAHGLCNGTKIRGGSMTSDAVTQNAAGVYVAAGSVGNFDIKISRIDITGDCPEGVIFFDTKRCSARRLTVNGKRVLPTISLTGWTFVSGSIYRQRTAPGVPGLSGVTFDRPDGNTSVVKNSGALVRENTSGSPTNPGTNMWGKSGGYVYIDLGGTDPNTQTLTSGIVSGYAIAFYSSTNGFQDMSQNVVEQCDIFDVDGFGIYMQLSNYPETCIDNKTLNNSLVNVCLKGSQLPNLPYAGIGWTGGIDCLSSGDTINGVGTAATPAPGFYALDSGATPCRGKATSVTVKNASVEGFRLNGASHWTYTACAANDYALSGFRAQINAGVTIVGLQLIGCTATGNALAGLSIDASAAGARCAVTILGGEYYSNTQQGVVLTAVWNSFVGGGIYLHDNGSTSFPQLRFVGDFRNCGVDDVILSHVLAGASFQLAPGQTTPFFYGKVSVFPTMVAPNLGGNVVQISGGAGVTTIYSGAGAPTIAGALGDRYQRIDTPANANQREYICTATGTAGNAVWAGIL